MRELRTSGSEGGPGRQPPRPTRLTTSAPKAFYVTAAVSASLRRPTSFAPPTRADQMGSNTAAEEYGIHVHAFSSRKKKPEVDDTFSKVEIDGITLEPAWVRVMMAQNGLPHIAGRVVQARCTSCGASHVDEGELAFTSHVEHVCERCGAYFTSRGRLRKTIGNPVVGQMEALSQTAVRSPQQLDLELIPETL